MKGNGGRSNTKKTAIEENALLQVLSTKKSILCLHERQLYIIDIIDILIYYIDRFCDFLLNINLSEAKPINYIFRN